MCMTIMTAMTMIMNTIIPMRNRGWAQMGGCTIAMMDWHHTHTSPSTPQATSAEEHLRLSIGTSMKEPSLLVLAALWELDCDGGYTIFIAPCTFIAWKNGFDASFM